MDSTSKSAFKRTLLSSAILFSMQGLAPAASASTCPPVNGDNNIHVSRGEFCSGGIENSAEINDIGLEGFVAGDVVNNHLMSDFWMNGGTLDGALINNGSAEDIYITNGSEIFSGIRNAGSMRYLTVSNGPGAPTTIHGDIVNEDGAVINNGLTIDGGASVTGSILNNGDAYDLVVDGGSSVGGDLINNGSAFGIAAFNGASIAGDFVNNGQNFFFAAVDGSTIGGSMINTGDSVFAGIHDGSTVAGDFGNEGYIDGVMMVDGATVIGNVYNSEDGYTDGIHITDGSSVGRWPGMTSRPKPWKRKSGLKMPAVPSLTLAQKPKKTASRPVWVWSTGWITTSPCL